MDGGSQCSGSSGVVSLVVWERWDMQQSKEEVGDLEALSETVAAVLSSFIFVRMCRK